jgi:ubiquinone/menaquinone biosynthesis C-methylase UbiE
MHATDVAPGRPYLVFGALLFFLGALMCGGGSYGAVFGKQPDAGWIALPGVLLALLGALLAVRHLPQRLQAGAGKFSVSFSGEVALPADNAAEIQRREDLDDGRYKTRLHELQADQTLPGAAARPFQLTEDHVELSILPSAQPMVPMYFLDKHFRILDWNEACTLIFDRTMEGRRGKPITNWVYWLDNYKDIAEESKKKFSDPSNFPVIDVEILKYHSIRYGHVQFKKRAYHIPHDDYYEREKGDRHVGWLVILEPIFSDTEASLRYNADIIHYLGFTQIWTEYSISYDKVLTNTKVYPELLNVLVGETGPLSAIPPEARVLDLGAGTGNLAVRLAMPSKRRTVVALDNNQAMLEVLKSKCGPLVRDDDRGPGVMVVKQDINSLFGLKDNDFDVVVLNNVLYGIEDPIVCLKEACRVLKPGGELRLSGPRADSDADALFDRIRNDLKENNLRDEYRVELEHVLYINKVQLNNHLYKYSTDRVIQLLQEAGFARITHRSDDAYAGQNMLLVAAK